MVMTYEYSITVRGYELDSFGHVNNAVYLNYMEQARWEILREKNLRDYFSANGLVLVVVSAELRYMKEATVFDDLTVYTTLAGEPPYLAFMHTIKRSGTGEPVTRGKILTLLVDNERVPHDIPGFFFE